MIGFLFGWIRVNEKRWCHNEGQNEHTHTRIFKRNCFVISEEGENENGVYFITNKSHITVHTFMWSFSLSRMLSCLCFIFLLLSLFCINVVQVFADKSVECMAPLIELLWSYFLFLVILLCQFLSLILCGTKTHD